MIIGLTGYKLSGKDTAGAYLMKQHGFERISYADNLKRAAAALLDIPFEDVDKYKNDETIKVSAYRMRGSADLVEVILGRQPVTTEYTFRWFLQRFSTEVGRHTFGRDFWVNQAMPKDAYYNGRKIVVTDVRFNNESERVKELGGYVVRIIRGDNTTTDSHETETSMDEILPDYVITNNGTIEDLYDEIEHLLAVM